MTEEQIQQIRAVVRDEMSKNKLVLNRPMQILDGNDMVLGKTNGTRFGTSTTQKLAFFGSTPVVRQAAITQPNVQGGSYNQTDAETLRSAINSISQVLQTFGFTA